MKKQVKKFMSALLACVMVAVSVIVFDMNPVHAASGAITEASGWLETAYVKWTPVTGATGYNVYVKSASASDSAYVQLDDELIRKYPSYMRADAVGLKAGDYVYITGTLYVARDAAHKRMMEVLDEGKELPINIKDCTIYYMGPSPAREGRPIGSAGPTTASRMDKYAPRLLDLGEKAMIGKGKRTKEVIDAVIRNKAVYFAAIGGAGALLSKCIKKSEIVCYEDLGAEAIRKIEVEDFPVIVVVDSEGNNLYETAIKEFAVED